MAYDFTSQLKNTNYIEFLKYGMKYYVTEKPDRTVRYDKDKVLPDKLKAIISSNDYGSELNKRKQAKFELSNGFWEYERCRHLLTKDDVNYETEFYNGVVESRTAFLKYALNGIEIKPNSIEKTDIRKISVQGLNGEKIDITKETRGTGDKEGFSVYVTENNKSMAITNVSSGYTTKYSIEGHPDIYEDKILSSCESYGCALTPEGLYIFSGDYRKKSEEDIYYRPNFQVNFYNIDSLSVMCGEYYNDEKGNNPIREEINKGCQNGYYLQDLINKTGILPDNNISIDCQNHEIVTLANAMYKAPQQFFEYYIENEYVR